MDILLILLIIGVVLALSLGFVALSVKRQGRVGTWIGTKLLSNSRVQEAAMKKIEQQLASDPDTMTDVAAKAGIPEAQARAALAQYQQMSPAEQQRILRRAEKLTGEKMPVDSEEFAEITGGTAVSTPARSAAERAQRDRARAKAKAARQSRKRNR